MPSRLCKARQFGCSGFGRAAGLAVSAALCLAAAAAHAQKTWRPTFEFDALSAPSSTEAVETKFGFDPPLAIAVYKPTEWAVLDAPARVRGGMSSYTIETGEALAGFRASTGELAFCHIPTVGVTGTNGVAAQYFDPSSTRATLGCFLDRDNNGSFEEWFTSYRTPPLPPAWRIKDGRTGKEETPIPYKTGVEGKQPFGQMAIGLDQFRGEPDVQLFAYVVAARGQMVRNRMLIGPKAERQSTSGEAKITLGQYSLFVQPGSAGKVRYRSEGDLKGAQFPEGWLTGR